MAGLPPKRNCPTQPAAQWMEWGMCTSRTRYVADTGNNVVRMLAPPSPAISADGVVNAASFAPGMSPGALGAIFGSNFLAVSASAVLPVPSSLSGVQVGVSGQLAQVLHVSPS